MKKLFRFLILTALLISGCKSSYMTDVGGDSQPLFSFGVVADTQYADRDPAGARHYRSSLTNLARAVEDFNQRDLAFVVHLGDMIDKDFESYDAILPIYNRITAPRHIVLGNHEFSVDASKKSDVLPRLGMTERYFDFVVDGWRFIAADGQGLSTYAPVEGALPLAEETLKNLQEDGAANAYNWNGGVDQQQIEWLKARLDLATENEEAVVLFCHFPAYPLGMTHNLWNDAEITSLLTSYPVVKAWFNGHNHAGFTGILEGIHFITFKGMVNYAEENAYAIVHVYTNRIVIEGIGAEDTRIIPVRGQYRVGMSES